MVDYKSIAKTYGAVNCGKLRFMILCSINECVDATYLVYKYSDSVKKRSLWRHLHRRRLVRRYGVFVGEHIIIEKGLRLPHPSSIIIGDGVVIKTDVTIYQNVTLGSKGLKTKAYPVLERGVTVFAGAKIIGNINLGESCTIGANSVVNTDVESGSVYAGIPARRIK